MGRFDKTTAKAASAFAVAARCAVCAGFVALAVFSFAATGCKAKRHSFPAGKTPLIGFSLDSLVVERWQRDVDIFTKAARDLGAEVILRVADQDPAVQEEQVRELIAKDIDVLVIVPNDADRLSAVVSEAKAKGIPVLSYDRLVRRAGVDLYVSFDNERVGSLMADAVSRAVPSGSYVVINGAKTDNNAVLINAGIHGVLDKLTAAGKVRIAAEIWPNEWDSGEVKAQFEAVIASDRRIDAVIAGNDMLAEAAIGVLAENRMVGTVRVTGQDAELSACQRIAEGTQYATVYKPIDRLALKAAGFAVMLAKGEQIDTDAFIDDGRGKVPFVRLEPILVTKDLLDATVIKDGFHTEEEVYRNVVR
ncbi:MAG: substrate-binding domain-containing protein [Rectinemataceae bacterium]